MAWNTPTNWNQTIFKATLAKNIKKPSESNTHVKNKWLEKIYGFINMIMGKFGQNQEGPQDTMDW